MRRREEDSYNTTRLSNRDSRASEALGSGFAGRRDSCPDHTYKLNSDRQQTCRHIAYVLLAFLGFSFAFLVVAAFGGFLFADYRKIPLYTLPFMLFSLRIFAALISTILRSCFSEKKD